MVYAPIWKDTYYTTTAATLNYRIYLGDNLIFSGKAYRMPDGSSIRININKICQNYLEQDIDNILTGSTSQTNGNAKGDFILKNSTGGTIETYRFLYDWDYEHSWTGQSATLSQPITGEYIAGQMKLKTTVAATGSSNSVTTYRSTGDYTKEICGCGMVLYYVNARGGWDCFAFNHCEKSDAITQHNYSKVFSNTTYEFENKRYISQIETSYKLTTSILTEEQSALFAKNVAGNNKCYLHNLTEGWIRPVVIVDSNVTYKTYDSADGVIYYELTVKESQTKQRM